MKILLIGNFAPPYEEENLHNISLFNKLIEEGHECTVLNISENPSENASFIDANGNISYFFKLLRHSLNKDVIHFLTKGYLRVGLLKLMLSIFMGTILRTKKILTIHSEFFSVLGQMRSPFGGTQTLNTSFYLADKIIFTDRDTYDVAKRYVRKPNCALVPSFIYISERTDRFQTKQTLRMDNVGKVVLFANVKHPSFLFETLSELLIRQSFPDDAGIVIVLSDKPSLKLQHALEDTSGPLKDRLTFIEYDDLDSSLKVFSRLNVVLRPMSCDGTTFFENFALCVKTAVRRGNFIYFPSGMVFVKEGTAGGLCAEIANTILASDNLQYPESDAEDSYEKLKRIYKE